MNANQTPDCFGLLAEFHSAEALLTAAEAASLKGYTHLDAYTPYPLEGMDDALRIRRTRLPILVFIGGLTGCVSAVLMMTIASVWHYPWNVGGRPFFSWPSFIPIAFEMTILFAAICAVVGMMVMNGLPMPHHPLFNIKDFERASTEGFFLCIEATDPQFDHEDAQSFLHSLKPTALHQVPL